MRSPRWAVWLLRASATDDQVDGALGDLEETHRRRSREYGAVTAYVRTSLEALDMSLALLRQRARVPSGLSLLDWKLGLRMLVKHPGLTVVGGLAIAFGISVAAVTFEVVDQIVSPRLPFEDGDRIVGLQQLDPRTRRSRLPGLKTYAEWRRLLRPGVDLAAFRNVERNLILGDGESRPVLIAQMTASGFGVTGVPPLRGRIFTGSDEDQGAPAVVVIGFDLWQALFQGDPGAVGRTVRFGGEQTTVVGVMPEGFGFPFAHQLWMPLKRPALDLPAGGGPPVVTFGRLGEETTAEQLEAEVSSIEARRSAELPEALRGMRVRVLPYPRVVQPLPDLGPLGLLAVNVFMLMLLVLICGNVALLTFARAVARESELAVRSALGASRGRIVGQLFIEALVLGGIAAVLGLFAAEAGVERYVRMTDVDSGGQIPFWTRSGLSMQTVFYLGCLTILGAAIVGVVPALKVSGRGLRTRLSRAVSGRTLALDGVWSAALVAQVAVTVTFPPIAYFARSHISNLQSFDLGVNAKQVLAFRIERGVDPDVTAAADTATAIGIDYAELERKLRLESNVVGATFGRSLPGMLHWPRRIEIEDTEGGLPEQATAGVAPVDVGYFDVLDAAPVAGRLFEPLDTVSSIRPVVVSQRFVEHLLQGRNAVGLRVRYRSDEIEPEDWHTIIGVVEDIGAIIGDMDPRDDAAIYHPVTAAMNPLNVAVVTRGDAGGFVTRLRSLGAEVDPELRLHDIRTLDHLAASMWTETQFMYRLVTVVSVVALLLSLTCIYSVTSFTVSRRTREIGVRVALGASAGRVVRQTLRGPLVRVLIGIAIGACVVAVMTWLYAGSLGAVEGASVGGYAAAMLFVCLLAAVVPTRRALAVQPVEALRAEG